MEHQLYQSIEMDTLQYGKKGFQEMKGLTAGCDMDSGNETVVKKFCNGIIYNRNKAKGIQPFGLTEEEKKSFLKEK